MNLFLLLPALALIVGTIAILANLYSATHGHSGKREHAEHSIDALPHLLIALAIALALVILLGSFGRWQ